MFNFFKTQKILGSIVQYSKETAVINPIMIANAYIREYELALETLIDVLQTNKNILENSVAFYIKGDSYEKIESAICVKDLSNIQEAGIRTRNKYKKANIIFVDEIANQHNLIRDDNGNPLKCTRITVTMNQLLELNSYVNKYNKNLHTNEDAIKQISTTIKEIALEFKGFADKYLNPPDALDSLISTNNLDNEELKRFLLGRININSLIIRIIEYIKDYKLMDK
jgi:hypothetical protein